MKTHSRILSWLLVLAGLSPIGVGSCWAGDLPFSDPATLTSPPAGAIGYPNRAPNLDALPGFRNPPPGYGEVGFYWWLGDPLTKERLQWQLEQLAGKGIMGLQINYAHSDQGGRSYGLTYASDPPLFSEQWWQLVQWFLQAAKQHGMAISLSDYTLGFGQGWYIDEILKENPELNGSTLECARKIVEGGQSVTWEVPASTLLLTAWQREGENLVAQSGLDLSNQASNAVLHWRAPAGRWELFAVSRKVAPWSLDPMNLKTGPKVVEKFFQRFEDRNPGEGGKGLNFFFSDELQFGVHGNLWTDRFAEEFRRRKGYDLLPELPALFADIGPRTPKVRLDYHDVLVALSEEGYFRPVFDWHQQRGMIYGCDHGGRGRDVMEFGDYFRTQRWNQGPGCDQPHLGRDIIKNKVASSISHLYLRPRTWLEGYYGSGWGTTPADLVDATFANFVMGQNLLTFHGLYYSTHGGFWEWAPPCNHFRMPYWRHLNGFMDCVQRLSYLLSQGHHRCDVAVLYPVAPAEAGTGGREAVDMAFRLGEHLYSKGIDFDFIDFESVARARVADRQLQVSGEAYRVLVLPALRAVRHSTLQKAAEFHQAGGLVILLGALPEASDRLGRNDPEVASLVAALPTRLPTPEAVAAQVETAFPRDYAGPGYVMHRQVGAREVYALYNAPQETECSFRAAGKVELWDPWTGQTRPLPVLSQTGTGTRLRLPLSAKEMQILVFSPGKPETTVNAAAKPSPKLLQLQGDWEFELQPTLDNRWGDFRWPPSPTFISAEARQFRYAAESTLNPGWEQPGTEDAAWPKVTASFGPRFWKLGPLPDLGDTTALEQQLAGLKTVDPSQPVAFGGKPYRWEPYVFSFQWGLEDDPGHQGYHGLKEGVTDEFIALGKRGEVKHSSVYTAEPAGSRYYLWTSVVVTTNLQAQTLIGGVKPAAAWLNHQAVPRLPAAVNLQAGPNPLLIRYDAPGRSYFVVGTQPAVEAKPLPLGALKMRWCDNPGVLPYDPLPQLARPVGWYRFTAPPGLRAMTFKACGQIRIWGDGQAVDSIRQLERNTYRVTLPKPSARPIQIALRMEQERGSYAGAALPEPIRLECDRGLISLGDWSAIDGLASYSGGAWYRKQIAVPAEFLQGTVRLNLGDVAASAEVVVNGKSAGIRVAPPWSLDISRLLKPGENQLEVLICNTLANHYLTIPTRYRGSPRSGLLGPVTLESVAP